MRFNKNAALLNLSVSLMFVFISCQYSEIINELLDNSSHEDCTIYDSFGIYLSDGFQLLSDNDIETYIKAEHRICLNDQGRKKWNALMHNNSNFTSPIPKLGNLFQKDFLVKLDNDEIYRGKFWSNVSSMSYDGIVILDVLMALDSTRNWIEIQNGYPAPQMPLDVLEDTRILQFFECKGKLR